MAYRHVAGDMGGGTFVIRTSLPGYDVLAEALGSPGISFDTRLSDIGTVIAAGLITCGGSPIFFPTMSYVPIVQISRWDGYINGEDIFVNAAGGGASQHRWFPAIGVVTTSQLSVIPYPGPGTYTATSFRNPTGESYLYSVFASG